MKKIVSLTLMSILCLTLFAGCGEPKNLSAEDIANKMKESGLPICNINDDGDISNKRKKEIYSYRIFADERTKDFLKADNPEAPDPEASNNEISTDEKLSTAYIEVYINEDGAIKRQSLRDEANEVNHRYFMYRYKNKLLTIFSRYVPKEAAEEYGEVFLDVCKKGKAKYKQKYSAEKQDTSNSTADSQNKKVESTSVVDSLDKLNDLKEKGTISDEEYEKLKKELLK